MARDAQDREDLMRDAVALVERMQIRLGDRAVVIGFRQSGAGSIYLGSDPAYHFNSRRELRRAIVRDVLYKAESHRLVAMRRERDTTAVILRRHELTDEELNSMLAEFEMHRSHLLHAFTDEAIQIDREIAIEPRLSDRVARWIERLAPPVCIAATARVS